MYETCKNIELAGDTYFCKYTGHECFGPCEEYESDYMSDTEVEEEE